MASSQSSIDYDVNPEKNKERSTLSSHATDISPALNVCEQRLHCIVEGIEKDRLLIRFSHLDTFHPEREFSFVVDLSTRSYKGLWYSCSSPLDMNFISNSVNFCSAAAHSSNPCWSVKPIKGCLCIHSTNPLRISEISAVLSVIVFWCLQNHIPISYTFADNLLETRGTVHLKQEK